MPRFSALSSRITLNKDSVSVSVNASVGSSIMITLDSKLSAFAISTICCSPIESSEHNFLLLWVTPKRANSLSASVYIFCQLIAPHEVLNSRPRKMFSAIVRLPTKFSSW